ncbi:carbon-nitrogen hydrolase family protein [Thermus thalpophilus]|uniref:carbon-nitrogen hydrolase family protein n=1 Tax=Thermus thalpophilus TaxID=2908147 RepID=UPI001FA99C18|nr:carbon-nitrogen hydrolase family protein [Thermus thalpophilus]
MRLALAHLAKRDSPKELLQALRPLAQEARAEGAGLLLLPELILGRRESPDLHEALAALAGEFGLRVVAGLLAARENRLQVFPQGPIYAKVHLYLTPEEEGDEGLLPGPGPVLFLHEGRTLGLALCYDLDFPELFRTYALLGAQAFLVGAAWPGAYAELMEVLARARAAENQAYLLLASRADTETPSLFVAPDGRVLGRREEEGLLLAEPDWGFLEAYRARYPLLKHRREGAYRLW